MSKQTVFASKNQRLAVKLDASIPHTLLALLLGDDDAGNNGADYSAAEQKLSRALYASSIGGEYVAMAYAGRFMLLERRNAFSELSPSPVSSPSGLQLASMGCDAASPGESVTAIHCISIYSSHTHYSQAKQQRPLSAQSKPLCVAVGYSSGYLRIFSMHGHLLTQHQFHNHQLVRIRLRMPSQANSLQTRGEMRYVAGSTSSLDDDGDDAEELCLTYSDGTLVCIDGKSLYLALRLCLDGASLSAGYGDTDDRASFMYKKWAFDLHNPQVYDAVSYGPAVHGDPLATLAGPSLTSSPLLSDATARFLVAPKHGDSTFGIFMTNEKTKMSLSAVDIAGKVAAKVTGAVLNIAKSYFWRSSGNAGTGDESRNSGGPMASAYSDPGTIVPCAFAIRDSPRKVLSISLAPAPYNLAALTDSLGRVLIFDLGSCEIVHMLKGLRGSQCAWLEIDGSHSKSSANRGNEPNASSGLDDGNGGVGAEGRRRMFVVVYAAKRGTVEVFELGSLDRPVASVNIGLGWSLVQCPTQPLGGSLPVGSASCTRRASLPAPAKCLLVDSKGNVARIHIGEAGQFLAERD
ncbi:hypothetical protein GGI12_003074 [Dipsacomyces acuminosporus]|nr:hypothetical protein GGI12_003074 [Dipsacomyces acuminosporus]